MLDQRSRTNQGVTILIIEDNWLFREMLYEAIQLLQPTWCIYTAKNGQEGLAMVQAQRPDLILLDFYMPSMNGYELALALQQSPEVSSIPLILSTSGEVDHPELRYLRTLCRAALFKPYSLLQLGRVLEQLAPAYSAVEFEHPLGASPALASN